MNLDPAAGETPTLGRKQSFFEELFGNIGTRQLRAWQSTTARLLRRRPLPSGAALS